MEILLTPSQGYSRYSNMFGGTGTSSSDLTPSGGSDTSVWKADTEWWGNSGDVCSTSSGGVFSRGDNGKDHWQINKIGTSQGHYLSTEITGFKFQAYQDSGAGHGMYIRRFGFRLVRKDSSSGYFYDAAGVLSRGSYGTKSYSHTFNSTILNNYLNNGWCFDEFRYQLSTQGGTGSRTTSVNVYNFEFNYKGLSGKKIILPAKRSYGDRNTFPLTPTV